MFSKLLFRERRLLVFPRLRIRLPLSAVLALFLPCSIFAALPALTGHISGFQAPASMDASGRRHLLKGADAVSKGDNLFEITQPRVTSFNADNTPDMFIESPRCLYDMKSNLASSGSTLSVRTADGRFAIEGSGWRWDPTAALLTISNEVAAAVQPSAISLTGLTNRLSNTNEPIRITSTAFQRAGDAASFLGNVLVRSGTDTLRCDRLNLQIGKAGVQRVEALQHVLLDQGDTQVASGQAVYELKENIIRISKQPKWIAQNREGSADLLLINRSNNTFFAEGSVYMKLPLTNVVATGGTELQPATVANPPATNRFLEIFADKFHYRNASSNRLALAVYEDHVRVLRADATIHCDGLTANFDVSNRVTRIEAQRNVSIEIDQNKAFGDEAVYDVAAEKMTLSGHPHWAMGDKAGRSDSLVFLTKTQELVALGDVEFILPGKSLGELFQFEGATGPTNSPAPASAPSPMTIHSRAFSHGGNVSVFQGAVQAADQRGTIDCGLLTVVSGASNQVEKIVAEQGVAVKQPGLAAFGEKAEYDTKTQLVRLTGDPELIMPDKNLRAGAFIIDRRRNTFSVAPGQYVLRLRPPANVRGNASHVPR